MFVHDDVSFEIRKLSLLIKREFENYGKSYQNSPTKLQAGVLFYLCKMQHDGKEVYQKDIEEEFSIRASTVTALIQNMEKAGLLARVTSSKDGRLKKLTTTEKSLSIIHDLENRALEVRTRLLKGLTTEDIQNFITIIHKLQNNLEEAK